MKYENLKTEVGDMKERNFRKWRKKNVLSRVGNRYTDVQQLPISDGLIFFPAFESTLRSITVPDTALTLQ